MPRAAAPTDALVECIDIVPTVLEALGLARPPRWLEGDSLLPLVHAREGATGKQFVVCENSYAFRDAVRLPIGQPVDRCHMTMLRDRRWKFVHFEDLPPMLSTCRPIRRSSSTWAVIRRMPRSVNGCSRACSTGCGAAALSDDPPAAIEPGTGASATGILIGAW